VLILSYENLHVNEISFSNEKMRKRLKVIIPKWPIVVTDIEEINY